MRVLMFGRGTIATIYGWALQTSGHEIEFYVRPGRAAEYSDEVRMDLIDGRRRALGQRISTSFHTTLRETLDPTDGFDLIVLSVGHHHLAEAAAFLAPRVGNASVLVLGNIWDEPLAAVAPLPADQVVFGFPLAGGGFGADGVLHGALLRSLIIGSADESPSQRERDVRAALEQAGVSIRVEKDMHGWLQIHFVSDAGMFAQAVRSGGMANMIGDRRAFRDAFLTSRELLPVLKARGVDLRLHRNATLPYRFPRLIGTMTAWATSLPIFQVSLASHTDPHAAEPSAVLEDTRREARRLNIRAPRLAP